MVIISGDVQKPDKLNLPQEHSSNTHSDLNAYTLCLQSPIPGYIAPKYSYRALLGRNSYEDWMSQEGSDYAEIVSKPLTCNNIGLDFVHTLSPPQIVRPTLFIVVTQTESAATQCEHCWPLWRGKKALVGFKLSIKCSRPEVTHATSAHSYGPKLYVGSGQRVHISSYVFIHIRWEQERSVNNANDKK